jgi:hypothetical protein
VVRKAALVALGLLALGLAAWSWLGVGGARDLAGLAGAPAQARTTEAALPRIALDRLKKGEAEVDAGAAVQRDLFQFGRPPAPPETPRPTAVSTLPVAPLESAPTPPPVPTLPPYGVKFVGSVEQKGTKVAILLSDDKKEVLTGREGDTVANRLRIVKIGLESVEVQDVGSDRVRRIPLKGN